MEVDGITFEVNKDDDGFFAKAKGHSIFCESKTLDGLIKDMREALKLHFGIDENEELEVEVRLT